MKKNLWETESELDEKDIKCKNLTYVELDKYTWDTSSFSMISTAHAQNPANLASTEYLLSVPLYITVFIFLLFVVTMSFIYMYHWIKFNLNDPFIKNFSIIYFIGLSLLLVPLIFNLLV